MNDKELAKAQELIGDSFNPDMWGYYGWWVFYILVYVYDNNGFDNGDVMSEFEATFDDLVGVAGNGDVSASYMVACAYKSGNGVKADQQRALFFAEVATNASHVEGMILAASIHLNDGDKGKCLEWYERAGHAGSCEPQYLLADTFMHMVHLATEANDEEDFIKQASYCKYWLTLAVHYKYNPALYMACIWPESCCL